MLQKLFYLDKTLSRFKMTHEEIVKRRMIKRDRILKEVIF